MLNTPVFLEIIGKRYGFINQNASLIQELIDEKEHQLIWIKSKN